ncbi:hypothetical protein BDZ45DRAFT_680395 [Acephala macrosclerotiorum]|nr:hypothetical protein BDZ45DRAFT_680395 [Acephala macrosclerotiorum]
MHPSLDAPEVNLSSPLAGICLICPFLGFDYDKGSYAFNVQKYFLTLDAVKSFNANFKPPGLSDEDALKDHRLSPLDAPAGWWKDCPVDRILLLMGEWEVFLGDCVEFGKRLQGERLQGERLQGERLKRRRR